MSFKFITNCAACDWLTLSVRGSAIPTIYRYCWGYRMGDKVSVRKMGMASYTGFDGAGLFYGERNVKGKEWAIVIASGFMADVHARNIHEMGLGEDVYCTRYDAQITIPKPEDYNPYLFREELEKATVVEWGMIGRRSKGMTLTCGDRSSDRYTRIYEKGEVAEDLPYIRWEIEFKGERSKAIWRGAMRPGSLLAGDIDRTCKADVSPLVDQFRLALDAHVGVIPTIVRSKPAAIKWLENQVSPCVLRLSTSDEPEESEAVKRIVREWAAMVDKTDSSP